MVEPFGGGEEVVGNDGRDVHEEEEEDEDGEDVRLERLHQSSDQHLDLN